MSRQKAYITAAVLNWARQERMAMPVELLATQAKVKPAQILEWEASGTKTYPSIRQAQRLAKELKIPFGYFFMH